MTQAEFVHLHVHSEFSMLDGAIRLKALVDQVREQGMPAVALTDHDNMHGAVRFHRACKAAELAPILGCEVSFTPGDRRDPSNRRQHHLVLLAASQEGYQNLVRLNSLGWVDSAGRARIDPEVLRAHHAGVVGLSACMGGYLAQEILMKGETAGRSALGLLKDCFAPEHFFVELQDHGFPEQGPLNEILVELAGEAAVPLVASNDCHYLLQSQARPQLTLQCIAAGRPLPEMERAHHGSDRMFLRSPADMAQSFRHVPEALKNTLLVAEMCGGACDPLSKPKLPSFTVPEGMTEADFLRKISHEGLAARFDELTRLGFELDQAAYRERLDEELEIIIGMGFPGYFLIVQDFINEAKRQGIPVGPGRGSGAGSLVAFSLRITDLDPIRYGLLFERFLNPERVSMPDFDVDFCMDRRDAVIDYVRGKYGEHSVGQIATFHQLKSRSVVRDVGRVMGMTPADAGRIASLIPEPVQGKTVPIATALKEEPRLKAVYDEDSGVKDLLDTAMELENLNRHAGMHAAGVVISEGPLWDHVPVFCPEPDTYVTQYDKDDVEAAGLVKFDFLGLKTLTVLDIAVSLIDRRPDRDGRPFDLGSIPMDDKATFALLQSGETTNVFQLESSGMQNLFRQLKPDTFEDIVAAVALYRPGPLGSGMVEDFVQRKHGRVRVEYPHPTLEDTLRDTYGVIVYQEQVMQIARVMAGYSLGGADLLRRAMGKKKESEMAKQRAIFIEGSEKNGHTSEEAGRIFDLVAHFAGYGFNKCLAGDVELVEATTGERVTIRELHERPRPFEVHAVDEGWKLRKRPVTDVVTNGVKPVYELTTSTGRSIAATESHRFRTLDGWTPLGELSVGDAVALPRALPVDGDAGWPDHELITLAGLLSEGNTCHPTCLYFYSNDEAMVGDFASAISRFPTTVAKISRRKGSQRMEVCASTGRSRPREGSRYYVDGSAALSWPAPRARRSGAFEWADELGLLGLKATEKHVPAEVFRLRDEDLELFLGRMWSGDGFVANDKLVTPFYATSSRRLAEDVQLLLLRLGMMSRIHEKTFRYRGGERPGYTVHVLGEGVLTTFRRRIGPHLVAREEQLAHLDAHLVETQRGRSSKDTIPAEVRAWVNDARQRAGLTWRELEQASGVCVKELYGSGSAKKKGFRRSTIAELASFFAEERLARLGRSDVYWDRVVRIELRGEEPTYDLTVDVDHNFVANGFVVHNSHSAAYALITYQTAYLKAHYPVEFVAATLTADKDKTDKVVRTVAEARSMGITVLPPDVNESEIDFTVVYADDETPVRRRPDRPVSLKGKLRDPLSPAIRFGLGGVKGIGESALEAIFEARGMDPDGEPREDGTQQPFNDVFDLCGRVDLKRVNKGVVEALVQCGAFDAVHGKLGVHRAAAHAAIESAIERGRRASLDREVGQTSLFGMLEPAEARAAQQTGSGSFPKIEPWDLKELLAREKTTLGFYVSGHPLERYGAELRRFTDATTSSLATRKESARITIGGSVEGYRERNTKSGGKMAFFHLEDPEGRIEVIVRTRALEDAREALTGGDPILLTADFRYERDRRNEDAPMEGKLILLEATPLAQALRAKTKAVRVRLFVERTTRVKLEALKHTLESNPGPCPVTLELCSKERWSVSVSQTGLSVEPSEAFLSSLERLFGEKVCELR